jgi:hypothetical protein
MRDLPGEIRAETHRDLHEDPLGDPHEDPLGDSHEDPLGDSNEDPLGDSHEDPLGDSNEDSHAHRQRNVLSGSRWLRWWQRRWRLCGGWWCE